MNHYIKAFGLGKAVNPGEEESDRGNESVNNKGQGLAKIYEMLAFILDLSVYLLKVPSLQEWTLRYQEKIWILNIFGCLYEYQCILS